MKKQRFQFHLSTALILTCVAGGLLWPNVRGRKVIVRAEAQMEAFEETSEALPGDPLYTKYGWPLEAASQLIGTSAASSREEFYSIPCQPKFHLLMATLDALIALAALVMVWFLCERWARRNKRAGQTEV